MDRGKGMVAGSFFHIAVQDGNRSTDERNLSFESVLDRVAIPFRLSKVFRVNGFDFDPSRLQRFRITRTDAAVDVGALVKEVDPSSLSSFFLSMAAVGQRIAEGEDVTDDVLKEADQRIAANGMTPDKRGAFDNAIRPDKAFVVMSFAQELAQSFEAISEASMEAGIKAIRVDKEMSSAPIIDRIALHLKESNFVIADLTKARPNVYYEIGYFDAICASRGVDSARHLLLVARDIETDAHFDLKHRGIQQYDNPYTLRKIVKAWLQAFKK